MSSMAAKSATSGLILRASRMSRFMVLARTLPREVRATLPGTLTLTRPRVWEGLLFMVPPCWCATSIAALAARVNLAVNGLTVLRVCVAVPIVDNLRQGRIGWCQGEHHKEDEAGQG